MSADPMAGHSATPAELKDRLAAERKGKPFLLYRDADDVQRILPLSEEDGPLAVGRELDAGLSTPWDGKVSRLHAVVEAVGGSWTVSDDGLSRNGTFVNHEKVNGRRVLRGGDLIKVGNTEIRYFAPSSDETDETSLAADVALDADLSRMQKQVLLELCRPLYDAGPYASPASNQEIAEAVHISTAAVKTHLRTLFAKFGLAEMPQNRKRAALAEAALRSGAVASRDF